MKSIIKVGDKFGRLTAIKFAEMRGKSNQYWLFKCICGNEKVINANNVKSGDTKSCGCFHREIMKNINRQHGLCKTKTYSSWQSMKKRCFNKNNIGYKNYGDRGITVCEEWKNSFENFYRDMGDRPKGKTIDRIDNNENYCKKNCRWATKTEQDNNRRNNHLLTYKNKTQTMKQWAEELNINYNTFKSRIRKTNLFII